MPPKAKAAGRGRAPAKRKLAEEFPPGEVLKDTMKKEWKLGAPIGQGGFGVIYLGKKDNVICMLVLVNIRVWAANFILNKSE